MRTAAHDGTLRPVMPEVREVAERWEEFTQYLCLGLCQDLGRTVTAIRPRASTRAALLDEDVKRLAADGCLEATVRVPDAVGLITIRADLRARQTLTSVSVDAPGEGRAKPRINWLLRQLSQAPGDLRIEVAYRCGRQTTSALLGDALAEPERLLYPQDPHREPKTFTLTVARLGPFAQRLGGFGTEAEFSANDEEHGQVQVFRWKVRGQIDLLIPVLAVFFISKRMACRISCV